MFRKSIWSLLFVTFASLYLSGCGHMAHQIVQPTLDQEFLLPEKQEVENELKGRAFSLSKVSGIANENQEKDIILPNEAYLKLLENQLKEAFSAANIANGEKPAYLVKVKIEEIEFAKKTLGTWEYDYLKVKLAISRSDNSSIMVTSIRVLDIVSCPMWSSPLVSLIYYNKKRSEIGGIPRLVPAISVEITKILVGLKEGKTLDQIEILREEHTGKDLGANFLLNENEWGIDELTHEELEKITGMKIPSTEKENN